MTRLIAALNVSPFHYQVIYLKTPVNKNSIFIFNLRNFINRY